MFFIYFFSLLLSSFFLLFVSFCFLHIFHKTNQPVKGVQEAKHEFFVTEEDNTSSNYGVDLADEERKISEVDSESSQTFQPHRSLAST